MLSSSAEFGEDGAVAGPICHHDRRDSPVQFTDLFEEPPHREIVPRWCNRRVQQMAHLGIDRHEQRELLAALCGRCLVDQNNRRQVGGRPPTGLPNCRPNSGSSSRSPRPIARRRSSPALARPCGGSCRNRTARSPARRTGDSSARARKLNLVQDFRECGKVRFHHHLRKEPNLPIPFAKLAVPSLTAALLPVPD